MVERYQASEPLTFGIWGANGNFTMGYTRTAEIASTPDAEWQYNAKYLISFVVSGTVTSNGIKDMYFAQINQSQFNGNAPETSIIIKTRMACLPLLHGIQVKRPRMTMMMTTVATMPVAEHLSFQ